MSKQPIIGVIGATGVGLVYRVPHQPKLGETVLGGEMRIMAGGKASNHALGVQRLGVQARLFSALGDDAFATIPRTAWAERGIDDRAVVTKPGIASLIGSVLVDDSGGNSIVIAPGAMNDFGSADVEAFGGLLDGCDIVLASLEMPSAAAICALERARANGTTTVLNPAPAPGAESLAPLVAVSDWVTPNLGEATGMTGRTDPEEAAQALLDLGARNVAITLGEEGVLVVMGGATHRVPAVTVDATDTSGAGDAFNSAFVVGLSLGADPIDAAAWGCSAAALTVQAPGFTETLHLWSQLPRLSLR